MRDLDPAALVREIGARVEARDTTEERVRSLYSQDNRRAMAPAELQAHLATVREAQTARQAAAVALEEALVAARQIAAAPPPSDDELAQAADDATKARLLRGLLERTRAEPDAALTRARAREAEREREKVRGERDQFASALVRLVNAHDFVVGRTGRLPHVAPELARARDLLNSVEWEQDTAALSPAEGEVTEDPRDAEIARLRDLVRSFTGEIAEGCDGEFSEDQMALIGIGISLGRQAEPDHPCQRCGGSGWWWQDTPGGEFDTMLRKCDHQPFDHHAEPVDGVCCSCGWASDEETECGDREDRTHCVHWWEGHDDAEPTPAPEKASEA